MRLDPGAASAGPSLLEEDSNGWLVTFSDLALQLFAFVLVATVLGSAATPTSVPRAAAPAVPIASPERTVASAGVAAVAAAAPDTLAPAHSLATELEAFVVEEGLGDAVHVTVKGGGVILSISDTIGFASGSAELLPDAGAVLEAVRALVAVRPDLVIEVSGHTDDRPLHAGSFRSNLDLSLARAARVAHALAANDSMLTSRIFAAGCGDTPS